MSEKEFDQGNEELFGVVNGHATPEATEQAEQIAKQVEETGKTADQPAEDKRDGLGGWMQEREEAWLKRRAAYQRKQIAFLILKVIACALAAGLFLAALLLPDWVPVLCYLGLAVCLCIVSIQIDRHAGRRRHDRR